MRIGLIVLIIGFLWWSPAWMTKRLNKNHAEPTIIGHDITLLIAHPDDEAMFFGPTLDLLTRDDHKNSVSILCLSTGNDEGLGEIRRAELVASAAIFGVPAEKVHVLDRPELQDGMENEWDTAVVAGVIEEVLPKTKTIVTFDSEGVSGHINHRSVYAGALYYAREHPGVTVWTLESVPVYRKYTAVIDGFLTTLLRSLLPSESRISTAADYKAYQDARKAMVKAHVSQMKWFRYGWITLSRYMWFNELVRA
ncbi:putative N-acetylglucosaminyl-phosphatidylinositol de-N-acetylase [Yarrowia sp. B02]|nr:putative N-acetylglucosaminyl-phosphatidylinositol de-N-acetylase [Yarrowia sp. B02]